MAALSNYMLAISQSDILARIERDNYWWHDHLRTIPEAASPRRVYFPSFRRLALNFAVKRATVLLGPRRVGKTFMIKQLVHEAITDGLDPSAIMYASIDTPIYSGISLDRFVQLMPNRQGKRLVIFDEIQYLPNWE